MERIPPKINKIIPMTFIVLMENKPPTCIKKEAITIKPIVVIKRLELKSWMTDFLSSISIFQYALATIKIGTPHMMIKVTRESLSTFNSSLSHLNWHKEKQSYRLQDSSV